MSTVANDVSCLLPTVHALVGGYKGAAHNADFTAVDENMCYAGAAKLLAYTAAELLYDGAENAKTVKKNFKPVMTKKDYLSKRCGINE